MVNSDVIVPQLKWCWYVFPVGFLSDKTSHYLILKWALINVIFVKSLIIYIHLHIYKRIGTILKHVEPDPSFPRPWSKHLKGWGQDVDNTLEMIEGIYILSLHRYHSWICIRLSFTFYSYTLDIIKPFHASFSMLQSRLLLLQHLDQLLGQRQQQQQGQEQSSLLLQHYCLQLRLLQQRQQGQHHPRQWHSCYLHKYKGIRITLVDIYITGHSTNLQSSLMRQQ